MGNEIAAEMGAALPEEFQSISTKTWAHKQRIRALEDEMDNLQDLEDELADVQQRLAAVEERVNQILSLQKKAGKKKTTHGK
jgi:hypothetical protein